MIVRFEYFGWECVFGKEEEEKSTIFMQPSCMPSFSCARDSKMEVGDLLHVRQGCFGCFLRDFEVSISSMCELTRHFLFPGFRISLLKQ